MAETPVARKDHLLTREIGDDLIVYDGTNSYAHTLDRVATTVWRACDGVRTLPEIAEIAGIDEALAAETVQRLHALDLMTGDDAAAISRRVLVGRAAKVGGVAAAVAGVPTAVALASGSSGRHAHHPRIHSAFVPSAAGTLSGAQPTVAP